VTGGLLPGREAREEETARGSAADPAPAGRSGEVAPIVHRGLVYRTVMGFASTLLHLWVGVRVEGAEHIPSGPAVLAANHRSSLDIPLIAHAAARRAAGRRHVAFVARDTLAHSKVLGFIMRHAGVILITRGRPDRAALREVAAHLAAGDLVGIFPEGTRGSGPDLLPFQSGALHAARRAAVPVIPCALAGTAEAWPRNRRFPRRSKVAILFGPAIDPADPDALAKVRTWMRGALAAMPEHPPLPPEPAPVDPAEAPPASRGDA
jgi:1-acyl-sn-glycerol-3-phosphate acyltransferase